MSDSSVHYLSTLLCILPATTFVLLALKTWFHQPFGERATSVLVGTTFFLMVGICFFLITWMIIHDISEMRIPIGTWFSVGHYHFEWVLLVDKLSLPFATLSSVLLGLVGVFSFRYLHRENGFFRFYLFLSLFAFSLQLVVLAGNLDLIFFGWEIVGICSTFLIAFFHTRVSPVRNGLWAFITYRVCDIGLLAAIVWCHHIAGGSFFTMAAHAGHLWPGLEIPSNLTDVVIVGLFIIWASLGKSAQIPFSSWLPRAMEGPTPSSAIFYGALSIHLGPFLLMRMWPIIEQSWLISAIIITIGLVTALQATLIGRVQSDIKSVLAYASMAQVGLIFAEIGFGFTTLALTHTVGHAIIRSLQILRSPNLLYDYHNMEQAIGTVLPRTGLHWEKILAQRLQAWLYRYALERSYFDNFFAEWLIVRSRRGIFAYLKLEETALLAFKKKIVKSALGDREAKGDI